MTALRDMFNNAFTSSSSSSSSSGTSAGGGTSNTVPSNQRFGDHGMATNLTETNNFIARQTETNNYIARQSNLVDEIIAQKQQARHPDFFPFNSTGETTNRQQGTLSDEFIMDLTRRVNSLSFMERQEAQNDIYGLGPKIDKEDPWEVSMKMNEMDELIRKGISGNDKRFSALRLAMHTNSNINGNNGFLVANMSGAEYVNSQKLKWLRSSKWSADEAVTRMALNFELKLEYFGTDALIRDLTMKDLSPTDIDLWKRTGFLQISEDRDSYGRLIMVYFMKQQCQLPHATVIRCLLYLSTIISRDETAQVVQLFWAHGQESLVLPRAKLVIQTYKALPLRCVARHLCYEKRVIQTLFGNVAETLGAWGTIRMRLHNGTAMECFYNLMTYGIPRNATPMTNNGEVELDFHAGFLDAIERKEADDEKRRRQERLDEQIRQMQMQNQMQYNNNSLDNAFQNNQGMMDGRGEPYQRKPPIMPIEESNETETSALMSWNMSGLTGMDAFSLRTEDGESLPDDFLKKLASIGSSATSSAISRPDTTPFPTHAPQQNMQPSNKAPIISSAQPPLAPHTSAEPPRQNEGNKDGFILVPGVYDVIMGRGRHNKKKPGNRKLNALLEAYQDEYEASDKFQKTVLSEVVVSKMIEDGSRFLVREGEKKHGIWVEVSLEKARDKVAHDFRNLRRSAKIAKENEMVADPSTSTGATNNELGTAKRQRSVDHVMDEENGYKRKQASPTFGQ